MTARVDLTLNGVALSTAIPSAYVLNVTRPLVGRRRHKTVDVPGRAGSWLFPEQPGDREIAIEFDLQEATFEERRAAVRDFAYWADIGAVSNLVISDEPERFYQAILDDSGDVVERLAHGSVVIRFLVGPYALASAITVETISPVSDPDSGTFVVTDRVQAEPVVEITPTNGTMTGFLLTVNGYTLSWAGALASGETITISSLSDTVTLGANDDVDLTGAFDEASVDMADVSGEFPLLFEGSNAWSISWDGTATTASLVFTWRERFR